MRLYGCCCSKPAAGIAIRGFTFRSAGAEFCNAACTTGCTLRSRRRPSTGGVSNARGKMIGGSSAISAMAYYHGHRSDDDRWTANRLPQWSHRHALPVFPPPRELGKRGECGPRTLGFPARGAARSDAPQMRGPGSPDRAGNRSHRSAAHHFVPLCARDTAESDFNGIGRYRLSPRAERDRNRAPVNSTAPRSCCRAPPGPNGRSAA